MFIVCTITHVLFSQHVHHVGRSSSKSLFSFPTFLSVSQPHRHVPRENNDSKKRIDRASVSCTPRADDDHHRRILIVRAMDLLLAASRSRAIVAVLDHDLPVCRPFRVVSRRKRAAFSNYRSTRKSKTTLSTAHEIQVRQELFDEQRKFSSRRQFDPETRRFSRLHRLLGKKTRRNEIN